MVSIEDGIEAVLETALESLPALKMAFKTIQ
jgi:hypothetical protein